MLKDTDQLDDLKAFLMNWYATYDSSYGVPEDEIILKTPRRNICIRQEENRPYTDVVS